MPKLTTQQVADLLGVSRPTVVRLIDDGELAAERIGNRRKVLLKDALDYRDRTIHRFRIDGRIELHHDDPDNANARHVDDAASIDHLVAPGHGSSRFIGISGAFGGGHFAGI